MTDIHLFRDLLVAFSVALVSIVVLARFHLPAMVAMVVAGLVAGPRALGLVGTEAEVEHLAELGIVLLLFVVGLDFSLAEFRRTWRVVLGGGVLQVGGTAAVVGGLAVLAVGAAVPLAILVGLFVALSSTAIVLKGLSDRNQADAPHGRLAIGVLLFQDLLVVVLILVVPLLSGTVGPRDAVWVVARALAVVTAVAVGGRVLLPPALRLVARSGRREAFTLAVLLASVGTAWLASLAGVSMALGAFLAGLVLADSEFSHQAYAEVRPLRDIFAGLFFVSLGMLVDPVALLRSLPSLAGWTLGIVLIKASVAATGFVITGTSPRVAAMAGVALAQVGEFSFILGKAGVAAGLLPDDLWSRLLSASVLTMVATPALLAAAPAVGAAVGRFTGSSRESGDAAGAGAVRDHVILLGFGTGGQIVARALRDLSIPYLILELNAGTVRRKRDEGEPIVFGDATSPESLEAAGLRHARAVVSLLSDPDAALRMVNLVGRLAPRVPVLVRSRYRLEAARLKAAGAAVAIAEELEGSLEILAQLYARLDVPGNLANVLLEGFRRDLPSARAVQASPAPLDALPTPIKEAPIETHRLNDDDWAVGRTLQEVHLRAETGASVLAIQSGAAYTLSPGADVRLAAGDVLYLIGDASYIMAARSRLSEGRGVP